jgi:protein-disulfide isomerase
MSMRPRRHHVITRCLAVACVATLAGCASSSRDAPVDAAAAATAPVAVELSPSELSQVQGISVGRQDAPVVIYEFADFQCPGCAQFASIVTPLIKQRYVDPGAVRYTYYDYPLISIHPNAFLASRAGRCANEHEKFWEYHDLLYARQTEWSGSADVAPSLVDYAEQIGIDRKAFEACLYSDRYAEEISKNMKLGDYLGIPGTPTLFVNGQRVEIRSLADLERIIQEAMGAAASG